MQWHPHKGPQAISQKSMCMFVKPTVSQGGEIFQNKQDSCFLILEWKRVHNDAAWNDYIFPL